MLPRDERRRLEEIESQLSLEDPEFTYRMGARSTRRWVLRTVSPRMALGVVAAFIAVLCLILGEGLAFAEAGVLATLVILSRKWDIRT